MSLVWYKSALSIASCFVMGLTLFFLRMIFNQVMVAGVDVVKTFEKTFGIRSCSLLTWIGFVAFSFKCLVTGQLCIL